DSRAFQKTKGCRELEPHSLLSSLEPRSNCGRSRPPASTALHDEIVKTLVGGAAGLHLMRRGRQELRPYGFRRSPCMHNRLHDRRLDFRGVEQDHVAANPKLVRETAELVDIVLRPCESYDRHTEG